MAKTDPRIARAVERLAASGATREQIGDVVGVPVRSLTRRYGVELARGRSGAACKLGGKVYRMAMSGSVAAAAFWLKCQGGWREVQRIETSGPDGAPVSVDLTPATVMVIPARDAGEWREQVKRSQAEIVARYGAASAIAASAIATARSPSDA